MPDDVNGQPELQSRFGWLAGRRKWAILVVIIMVGVIVVIQLVRRPATQPSDTNQSTNSVANTNTTTIVPFQRYTVPTVSDQDKDGLTDEEEAQVQTNPKLVDTDSDQLSDYDEVRVYSTGPLKPDTDGDGVKDGVEVLAGSNPKGPGQLRDIRSSITNSQTKP